MLSKYCVNLISTSCFVITSISNSEWHDRTHLWLAWLNTLLHKWDNQVCPVHTVCHQELLIELIRQLYRRDQYGFYPFLGVRLLCPLKILGKLIQFNTIEIELLYTSISNSEWHDRTHLWLAWLNTLQHKWDNQVCPVHSVCHQELLIELIRQII